MGRQRLFIISGEGRPGEGNRMGSKSVELSYPVRG